MGTAARPPRGVRILGVDPGSLSAGWGVLDAVPGWGRVSFGVVAVSGEVPRRLAMLSRRFREIAEEFRPDVAALEEPFFGKDVRSLLRLGEARGAILAVFADLGIPIVQYPPAVVKRAVTGNGNAAKSQVAAMVARLLGGSVREAKEDASDALAVALCCAHRQARAARLGA